MTSGEASLYLRITDLEQENESLRAEVQALRDRVDDFQRSFGSMAKQLSEYIREED